MAREMSQWVKCLLCKYEELNSDPYHIKPGVVVCTCNPSTRVGVGIDRSQGFDGQSV